MTNPPSPSPVPVPSAPVPPAAPTSPAASRNMWIAFLLVCFLLTGMVGLFASYGPSIPLERALYRMEALDRATATTPFDADALRLAVGGQTATDVLNGPGDEHARLARARAAIIAEARDDQAGVGARTRLMLYVVTALSAAIGTFILLVVSRQNRR